MKKILLILSSLRAGGAERVFWLLSQYFNKEKYSVVLVLLDSRDSFYPKDELFIPIIDLKSIRSSKSILKLSKVIAQEKPYAIYSTAPHINILVSIISLLRKKMPIIIARESCVPDQMVKFTGVKGRFADSLISQLYKRFNSIVCQSEEMKNSLLTKYHLDPSKIVIIHNPIVHSKYTHQINSSTVKRLIIVARLAKEKGHLRLLKTFARLPTDYHLTIAGSGPMKQQLQEEIERYRLEDRVTLIGEVHEIPKIISEHDLLVLSSYTEGFPNAIIESLSVGTPVVTFEVGGTSEIIRNGFNGYIVSQDDVKAFQNAIIRACTEDWDALAIKTDAISRFGIQRITKQYENLIETTSSIVQ